MTRAAGIVYTTPGGKILMMKRRAGIEHGETWALPAGKIEEGETPDIAARREFEEETGRSVSDLKHISTRDGFAMYRCNGDVFEPKMCDEHTELGWFSRDELPSPLHPHHEKGGADELFSLTPGMDSARLTDINGFMTINGNPLSKVGVFPYLGKSIAPDLEPEKTYWIYRPEEELNNPETIESFKLLPLTDDHAMLGKESDGLMPAEVKGVHGVIGEDVYYEDGYLKGKLKIFSEKMGALIAAGKKELSAGYRCLYDMTPGTWNGKKFDGVQRSIRGNHQALVLEGRMGPDVAVLDHLTFTVDAKEFDVMTKEELQAALAEALAPILARLDKLEAMETEEATGDKKAADADPADPKPEEAAPAKDGEEEKPAMTAADAAELKKQLKNATDSIDELKKNGMKTLLAEVAERDKLAEQVSHHIGAFDHKDKTLAEVATYACDKLDLKPAQGHELATLKGFLHNRPTPAPKSQVATDAAPVKKGGAVDAYINPKA